MAWDVSATVETFEAALKWFRARVPMSDEEYDALAADAHERAFKVAGLSDLDVVADVWSAIDRAIGEGTSFADFKDAIGDKVKAAWGGTVDDPAWRLETIFRTNTQSAYTAGRYEQMTDPDVIQYRPYWGYVFIDDARQSDICAALEAAMGGQVYAADDPSFATRYPPLHHACRTSVRTFRKAEGEKRGVSIKAPEVEVAEGFGKIPTRDNWEPDVSAYPTRLRSLFEEKQKSPPDSTV